MTTSIRNLESARDPIALQEIQAALRNLRFGAIEITVHNGQVVQIERKEKFRLQTSSLDSRP